MADMEVECTAASQAAEDRKRPREESEDVGAEGNAEKKLRSSEATEEAEKNSASGVAENGKEEESLAEPESGAEAGAEAEAGTEARAEAEAGGETEARDEKEAGGEAEAEAGGQADAKDVKEAGGEAEAEAEGEAGANEVAEAEGDDKAEAGSEKAEADKGVVPASADDSKASAYPAEAKIGPKIFTSSMDMFNYFYDLLRNWPLNLNVNKYEHLMLEELINQGHPEPGTKKGVGVEAFQVRVNPDFYSRCYYIIRRDGSIEDFSYRKCVDHILPLPDEFKARSNSNDFRSGKKRKGGGGYGGHQDNRGRGGWGHGGGRRGGRGGGHGKGNRGRGGRF